MLSAILPISVDNLKRNVLVWRASVESQNDKIHTIFARLEDILWCFALVDQVWIKDIELVALHNLRRRIVVVIMRLVVLIPLETSVNTVKEARLPRAILVLKTDKKVSDKAANERKASSFVAVLSKLTLKQ